MYVRLVRGLRNRRVCRSMQIIVTSRQQWCILEPAPSPTYWTRCPWCSRTCHLYVFKWTSFNLLYPAPEPVCSELRAQTTTAKTSKFSMQCIQGIHLGTCALMTSRQIYPHHPAITRFYKLSDVRVWTGTYVMYVRKCGGWKRETFDLLHSVDADKAGSAFSREHWSPIQKSKIMDQTCVSATSI